MNSGELCLRPSVPESRLMETPPTYVEGFHNKEAVAKMGYKKLGETHMIVSEISFGAAPLGDIYGQIDDKEKSNLVLYALQHGINFIDTAPWYGNGKSEKALGRVLPNIPRESYYLATKVGRYCPDYVRMFNFSAEHVVREFHKSLKSLGVDYVDLLQVHDIEMAPSLDVVINETLPALEQLKGEGKTRYIGITGYPVSVLKEVVERSDVIIDTVLSYCRCTLADRTLLEYLPFFEEMGVGVINGSPLSMGLFTEAGPQKWHLAGHELREAVMQATDYCIKHKVDISKLALKYSLSRGVTTTLTSSTSIEMLTRNLNTYFEPLSDEEIMAMEHILSKYFIPVRDFHWEGLEREKFNKKLLNIVQQNGKQ